MNTAVMNVALMDQCRNPTMMRLQVWIALNVIYKCLAFTQHLVSYLRVVDGAVNHE
jgi:hypothetical protein